MPDPLDYLILPSYKGRYDYYNFSIGEISSDPYDFARVRSYDRQLHRTLSQIFRERRLTSAQIRRLVRAPRKCSKEESIFKLILEREPDLGKLLLKRSKLSLLWIAVLSYYQASAELLVRSGADLNELFETDTVRQIFEKSNLLHVLSDMYPSLWNDRFIDMIIDRGIDIRAKDSPFERTAMHTAVVSGRVKMTEKLLEKGADVNALDSISRTPLLSAVQSKKVAELVPLLLKHRADVTAIDMDGRNVLWYLVANAFRDNVDLARVFIEKGVSPREITGLRGNQPIHAAVENGHNELVNLFLDHGANVNAQKCDKNSPLYIAAQKCDDPAVLLTLLKRGANIDLKNWCDKTALHGLIHGRKMTMEKLKLFLSVGADMFAKDINGLTPFAIAYYYTNNMHSVIVMLKTLALKKACSQSLVEFRDEKMIRYNYRQFMWMRYQNIINEINRMKFTKIEKTGELFELLTKCQCQLVPLMRNLEFKSKFKYHIYHRTDLDFSRSFSIHAADIIEAFERAEKYYSILLEQEDLFEKAIYNRLPYMIVRRIVHYSQTCEVCEMKKTVHASRGIVL